MDTSLEWRVLESGLGPLTRRTHPVSVQTGREIRKPRRTKPRDQYFIMHQLYVGVILRHPLP